MEDGGVPTHTRLIDCGAGIDVRPPVEEQSGRGEAAVFRGDMEERSSLNGQAAAAALAAIELGEMPAHQRGIRVDLPGQAFEPAAEQIEDPGRIVPGRATGLEKDVDARAQPLGRPAVRRDDVVERRAGIGIAGGALPRVAKVRIRAMVEEPLESGRVQ